MSRLALRKSRSQPRTPSVVCALLYEHSLLTGFENRHLFEVCWKPGEGGWIQRALHVDGSKFVTVTTRTWTSGSPQVSIYQVTPPMSHNETPNNWRVVREIPRHKMGAVARSILDIFSG